MEQQTTSITELAVTYNNTRITATASQVVRSNEPIFSTLAKQDYNKTFETVAKLAERFIKTNTGQDNSTDVALGFAENIIENEPTWKLMDIVAFFKFILNNQHRKEVKIYGALTPLKMMEIKGQYEDEKCAAREALVHEIKQGHQDPDSRTRNPMVIGKEEQSMAGVLGGIGKIKTQLKK